MEQPAKHRIATESSIRCPISLQYEWRSEIHNKDKMKRRFEVAYYECGLTRRKTKRFFFELSAYLYKGWLDYQFKGLAQVEIYEYE